MVSEKSVQQQLKNLGFNIVGWGRGEVRELANIILPGEEIYEAVNGIYEGGFALLLATDVRVLLVDKKPLNFLTVEDLRFDMINEIDYNHRLIGAYITIATGNKYLKFRSYNQPRLRKLINHVQHAMAEVKKKQMSGQEGQTQHLKRINQQLQNYLVAQQQQQQRLQDRLKTLQEGRTLDADELTPEEIEPPVKLSNELSDYLLAQRLLADHAARNGQPAQIQTVQPQATQQDQMRELYAAGMKEIFGQPASPTHGLHHVLEVHPLKVAYSKLPLVLKYRKFKQPALTSVPTETDNLTS